MNDQINADGLATIESTRSVEETIARVRSLLAERQIKEFALIDHSGEAERAGLTMPKTQVVIFGNPKGGTPLMIAAPSIAIDLPLRLLVSEDAAGRVWIRYLPAKALLERHGLDESLAKSLAVLDVIASDAASR